MTFSTQFSTEFITRVKAVTEAPENFNIKAEALSLLMQMKTLATRGDAMAQYRLAQVYPKNSHPYLTWMQAAANQGFTSAMLALSLIHAEHGTPAGLQKAAAYIVKILSSNDSYIKSEATAMIERNHLLGAEVRRQLNKACLSKSNLGFFAQSTTANEQREADRSESPEIQANRNSA